MRLTNAIRDAFVNGVMGDVPQIDYQEQAIKLIQSDDLERLPPEIKKIVKMSNLVKFLDRTYYRQGCYISCQVYIGYKPSSEIEAKINALDTAHRVQIDQRKTLRQTLRIAAYTCRTRKALVEALPEFEKYLPASDVVNRRLPVAQNVVSDFVAAGWPKESS